MDPFIPEVVENLGIWQESRANFLNATSDHCCKQGARSRRKICCEADAAKNQSFNHFRYIINGRSYLLDRQQVSVPHLDLMAWLESHPLYPKVFWKEQGSQTVRACVGNVLSFSEIPHFDEKNPCELRLYGGMRFGGKQEGDETWKGFPESSFWLPHIELTQENGKTEAVIYQSSPFSPLLKTESPPIHTLLSRQEAPPFEQWEKSVQTVLDAITSGDIDKLVLARKTVLQFTSPLSPWPILSHLNEKARRATLFAFQLAPDRCFFGATPEKLFVREGLLVNTEAVAATRPRGKTEEEDLALENDLLTNGKEQREFKIVKDYLTAALSPLSETLRWENDDRVLKASHVQHLYNSLKATLKSAVTDAALVRALHPTPALGGHPREKALQLLQKLEPFDRGWYGGPIGTVGQQGASLYVAIRSALIEGSSLHLFAGTGLVPGSTAEREWEELEQKIRPLTEFFCG